jgi:hypothetical protein
MIDDFTLYEGGFLVLFGQAPPQHAFLEAWLCGLCSLVVFAIKTAAAGQGLATTEGYFVAGALRDFYNAPEAYYAAYRSLLIGVDLVTALLVFKLARQALADLWASVWVTAVFLFTFNTLWSVLVGRPDTLMTCASTAGVYLYLRSAEGRRSAFWWSAICLGIAAGLKMQGGLIRVFVVVDLLRRHGLRAGWRPAAAFGATAVFFFLVADGSLLFDPLMYVKARLATYRDDYSPYIHWGDQFVVILRSTGWVIAPLALVGAAIALRDREAPPALKSVAVIALGWLLIFCATRQLRGYWMLAAAPLFYVLAARVLMRLEDARLRVAIMAGIVVVMAGQTAALAVRTARTDVNELRAWVESTVQPGERFYTLGDTILRLPKDTGTMRIYKTAYEREIANDLAAGTPFVARHVKNWEERAQLRLFDMLGFRNAGGYAFFNYRDFPPEKFGDLVALERMDYLIVQQQFATSEVAGLDRLLAERFRFIGERRSEGGNGGGLMHRIYRRTAP